MCLESIEDLVVAILERDSLLELFRMVYKCPSVEFFAEMKRTACDGIPDGFCHLFHGLELIVSELHNLFLARTAFEGMGGAMTFRGSFLKTTFVSDVHPANARSSIKRPTLLKNTTLARLLQPKNAEGSINLTEEGISMLARFVQPPNASPRISFTVSGIETLTSFEIFLIASGFLGIFPV